MPRKTKVKTTTQQGEHGVAAVAEPPAKPKRSSRKARNPKVQPDSVVVDSNQSEAVNTAAVPEVASAIAAAERVEPQPASGALHAELPAIPATPPAAQSGEPTPPETNQEPERPRFRSWSFRKDVGYEKLTDQKRGLLVLKFTQKPSDELLATIKDAGFRYSSDYEGQGKVWLRKNDFEGRVQVDKIEATLRQLVQNHVPGR